MSTSLKAMQSEKELENYKSRGLRIIFRYDFQQLPPSPPFVTYQLGLVRGIPFNRHFA